MSHVFISYARKDQESHKFLDKFIRELKKVGFTDDDIWYDSGIEAGTRWRIEIDTALEESFAVVVLLGPAAMKSEYVTYEWSWAVGNGTPLFPLVLKGSYDDVHPRLLDLHCVDCRKEFPASVIEAIKEEKETPRDIDYLNRLIQEMITPFRILLRVSLWLAPYAESHVVERITFHQLLEAALDEAATLQSSKLPELMVNSSGAFTSKQRRKCRQLTNQLLDLWKLFHVSSVPGLGIFSVNDNNIKEAEQRRKELENIISFFESDQYIRTAYSEFDIYLTKIDTGGDTGPGSQLFIYPAAIIEWYLKDDSRSDTIIQAIQQVKAFQARKNSG